MRVLLIGATGFIGPHVVRKLACRGHELAVFHRGEHRLERPVREIIGDRKRLGASAGQIRDFAPEVVIDMVLSSGAQAEQLLETIRGVARRVIALSSMDVYRAVGISHGAEQGPLQDLPLTEDSELRRVPAYPEEHIRAMLSLYSWVDERYNKVDVERVLFGVSDGGPAVTILRLPMIYGPGDLGHRFYPVLKRIQDGRRRIIFTDDFAAWRGPKGYVEDVAHAIVLATISEQAAGRLYNVAEQESFTELEWAQMIAREISWDGEFVVVPRERAPKHLVLPYNFAQHWVASSERIRSELRYKEKLPVADRVKRTVEWELANPPSQYPFAQFDYEAEDRAAA
jgi:nucleoside-diphosphate-sugar epimerase